MRDGRRLVRRKLEIDRSGNEQVRLLLYVFGSSLDHLDSREPGQRVVRRVVDVQTENEHLPRGQLHRHALGHVELAGSDAGRVDETGGEQCIAARVAVVRHEAQGGVVRAEGVDRPDGRDVRVLGEDDSCAPARIFRAGFERPTPVDDARPLLTRGGARVRAVTASGKSRQHTGERDEAKDMANHRDASWPNAMTNVFRAKRVPQQPFASISSHDAGRASTACRTRYRCTFAGNSRFQRKSSDGPSPSRTTTGTCSVKSMTVVGTSPPAPASSTRPSPLNRASISSGST